MPLCFTKQELADWPQRIFTIENQENALSKELESICYLCGGPIECSSKDDSMKLSMDHIPPKQFYPKSVRQQQNLNLELAPSHKKCNEEYRKDEEYFYHSLYLIVKPNSPNMGKIIWKDFKRSAL